MKKNVGFTLVEMLVVIVIITILASVVLYSATKYINKGKDAAIKGNLAVLVTAGELWYDRNNSTYTGFCGSPAVMKALTEPPPLVVPGRRTNPDRKCNAHCAQLDECTAWAVCSKEFVDNNLAYCVDSKGNQKEIYNSDCTSSTVNCCFAYVTNCIPYIPPI